MIRVCGRLVTFGDPPPIRTLDVNESETTLVDELHDVGVQAVYAAGEASDRPIKQGGLACQQADTVPPTSPWPRSGPLPVDSSAPVAG